MKILGILIVALSLGHIKDVTAKIKVSQHYFRKFSNTHYKLAFNHLSYVDGRLTYAICDDYDGTEWKPKFNCTVKSKKHPYEDHGHSCNVTLDNLTDPHHTVLTVLFKVTPIQFGERYVALAWIYPYLHAMPTLNFTIVQMDTCKVEQVWIDADTFIIMDVSHVVGRNDTFDVFYDNPKFSCGGKTCKTTIDSKGNIVDGPKPSIGKVARNHLIDQSIVSLGDNSSAYEYFYIKDDGHENVYTLVKHDGTEKSLMRRPSELQDFPRISANNKLIGVCYPVEREYKCNQYDFDGNSKLEITLPKASSMQNIYNIRNGGFYAVSTECRGLSSQYLIERFDSEGKKTGSFDFEGYDDYNCSQYDHVVSFYDGNNNETCVSVTTSNSEDHWSSNPSAGEIYLNANCFTDADFSK